MDGTGRAAKVSRPRTCRPRCTNARPGCQEGASSVRVWIDIENPPQVQYLSPFKERFERLGADVVVTAKDYGIAHALLRQRGIEFEPVGEMVGRGKLKKIAGLLARTHALVQLFKRRGRPNFVVSASRPSALAAVRLGVPAFVIDDYEYADLRVYGFARCWLMHPDVIPPQAFAAGGARRRQLMPFRGLKEDITFHGFDLEQIAPYDGAPTEAGPARVLFRPPAEQSHYYHPRSAGVAGALLDHLSRRADVVVLYAPRYSWQVEALAGHRWENPPVQLSSAVPFVPLLRSVDAVVSSGGTMIREAAYLGIPAYSILQSRIGAVDRHLESLGRLSILSAPADFDRIGRSRVERLSPLATNPQLLDELTTRMTQLVQSGEASALLRGRQRRRRGVGRNASAHPRARSGEAARRVR